MQKGATPLELFQGFIEVLFLWWTNIKQFIIVQWGELDGFQNLLHKKCRRRGLFLL